MSNGSNGSKRNAGPPASGIAKRRRGPAPQPPRPFVVAAKPTTAGKPPTSVSAPVPARKTASAPTAAPKQPTSTKAAFVVAAPRTALAPVDGSLLRVTRYALVRYLGNPWFAVDAVLLLALFVFCYRSSFDTNAFFTSADFLLGILSAISAYGLVHGVVPPEQYLPLARANGAARTVGGLTLAAVIIRTAYCLIFVGLALAFKRFYSVPTGPLLAGWLGLIVACAYLAAVIVCLSSPIAPRTPRIVALVLLMLGFASFNATNLLGGVLFVARVSLFPFIAPYRLAASGDAFTGLGTAQVAPIVPSDLLAWLGTLLLAPAAIVGLILLAGYWLRRSPALDSTESATDAPAQPIAVTH